MKPPSGPLFLARRTYRRRRLVDAIRLLPILGVFLFFLPLLWGQGASTTTGLFYLFGAWFFLILAVGVATTAMSRMVNDAKSDDP